VPPQSNRVLLHIEPRPGGQPWEVDAHDLRTALARAAALLGSG
jgi:hypothetical protein